MGTYPRTVFIHTQKGRPVGKVVVGSQTHLYPALKWWLCVLYNVRVWGGSHGGRHRMPLLQVTISRIYRTKRECNIYIYLAGVISMYTRSHPCFLGRCGKLSIKSDTLLKFRDVPKGGRPHEETLYVTEVIYLMVSKSTPDSLLEVMIQDKETPSEMNTQQMWVQRGFCHCNLELIIPSTRLNHSVLDVVKDWTWPI